MRSMVRLPTVGRHRDAAYQASPKYRGCASSLQERSPPNSSHAAARPIEPRFRGECSRALIRRLIFTTTWSYILDGSLEREWLWRLGLVLPSLSTARPRPGTATSTSYEPCRCWW